MKQWIVILLLCFSFLTANALSGAALADDAEGLRIGWASTDITPDRPVFITGQRYARLSEGVMDPITATALALESRFGDGVILVSCDLISIPDEIRGGDFRGHVRELVGQALPDDQRPKVVLNATHTHAGPEIRDRAGLEERLRDAQKARWADKLDTVMQPQEYIAFAAERIADVAVKAWQARKPGGISFGLSHAVVGHNRIMAYKGGTSRMYGPTDRPDFSHVEGWEDHSVNLIYTWDRDASLTGVVVNLPSPSQHDENSLKLSADFWHETREELRRRLGDELFVLAQCSAAGDQSERVMIHRRAERRMERLTGQGRRERIATRIADAVTSILPHMKEYIDWNPVFAHHMEHVELPTRARGENQPGLPVEVYVLRLGDIALATNPFELYLDLGIRIQERSKAVQTFVVQLAGSGSYLATERAAKGGAYGSRGAYRAQGNIGPEGGRVLVERTVAMINQFFGLVGEIEKGHGLRRVGEKRLPRTGWRFSADPEGVGRERNWHQPGFDDGDWRDDVPVETSWQNYMEEPYQGAAWYRRTFELPDVPPWTRAFLMFEGVDEQAWVWVNGQFSGEHTLGPSGWNVPFMLEVTDALSPDAPNQITVKAANTAAAGGIWKPVTLHFFRPGR